MSSILGGCREANVSDNGLQIGTIRGGEPFVRLAIYKVSWWTGLCCDSDMLVVIDNAINDGIHVCLAPPSW